MYARKLERGMPAADIPMRTGDIRWPRHRRVAFLAVAASLCWAVPVLVAYFVVT